MGTERLPRFVVLSFVLAAAVVLGRAGHARAADGFTCPPAPAGWNLDEIRPTKAEPSPGPHSGEVIEWRAACLYAETTTSIHVRPGLEEGGVADAHVYWTETDGFCPLPTLNFGNFTSEVKDVEGDIPSDSKRAVADYSYEPVDDPFNGGMKDLAARLLAAAEPLAGSCAGGGPGAVAGGDGSEETGGDGPSPEEIEIAGGLILLLLGGGGLALSGAGAGTGLLSGRRRPGRPDQQDAHQAPPVVTIASPGQGDEVGQYVTVTGTVTDAAMVTVTAPGGAASAPAAGGTFSATVLVGVKHAAIVVEAANAAGTGRAAVHVYRPDGPDRLPDEEPDHAAAIRAQQDAANDAFLAHKDKEQHDMYQRSLGHDMRSRAPIVPHSLDELLRHLSAPQGGSVGVSAKDARHLIPPLYSLAVSKISIDGGIVTVDTAMGSGAGSLRLAGDRVEFVPAPGSNGAPMRPDLAGTIQARLDDLTGRLHGAGVEVTEIRTDGGRIWITTSPRLP